MPARRPAWGRRALGMVCVLFGWVTRWLPLGFCTILGKALGTLAFVLVPRLRVGAIRNLRLAYGDDLSPDDARGIALAAAQHLGIVGAQFSRIPRIDDAFVRKHVRFEGLEHIANLEGAILIGAHLGNWEWMAPIIRTLGLRTAVVVRPLDDPTLARYVDATRRANGVVTIGKAGAGPELVRLVREGYLVGILVDQSPRENGVPVTFYGRPCWASIAPVMVSFRAHAPVLPISLTREGDGSCTLAIHPPIELVRTGRLRSDIVENSQRCQDAVERLVRAHPEQWLWAHRRWKARPQLEEEWQQRISRDRASRQP